MITVWVSKDLVAATNYCELRKYLHSKGLDLSKSYSRWESLQKPYSQGYRGTALPDRVVSVIKTVIGVVPITKSWEGVE